MVRIEDESKEMNFSTRWNNPGNTERYNLLPGEPRSVHLFKIYLLPFSKPIPVNLELQKKLKGIEYKNAKEIVEKAPSSNSSSIPYIR